MGVIDSVAKAEKAIRDYVKCRGQDRLWGFFLYEKTLNKSDKGNRDNSQRNYSRQT